MNSDNRRVHLLRLPIRRACGVRGLVLGVLLLVGGSDVSVAQSRLFAAVPSGASQPATAGAGSTNHAPIPSPHTVLVDLQRALSLQAESHGEFLRKEAEVHRSLLESSYTLVVWVIGILTTCFVGGMAWFNWKAGQDIERQVREQFREKIENAAAAELGKLTRSLKELDAEMRAITARGLLADALEMLESGRRGEPIFETIREEAVREGEFCASINPSNERMRRVGILLGRLKKVVEGFDEGIDALTRFIQSWERFAKRTDEHLAALLYNRACYRFQSAQQAHAAGQKTSENPPNPDTKLSAAWEDLVAACVLDFECVQEAAKDDELKPIFTIAPYSLESLKQDVSETSRKRSGRKQSPQANAGQERSKTT